MNLLELPLSAVYPNPEQPRKHFDPTKLAELAASIAENGLLQPIKVRPDGAGRYMVVCGERRWRAHGLAGKSTIKAIVEEMTDDRLADEAIIENLQRLDITPLEEARAFQARLDQGLSVTELAKRVGVAPVRVQFRVALLRLAPEYQEAFQLGMLDKWQAHYMARLSPGYQRVMFEAIRDGRCRTRGQAQAWGEKLARIEANPDEREPEQSTMFNDSAGQAAGAAALSAIEKRLLAVTDLVCRSFDENQTIIAGQVSPSKCRGACPASPAP